MSGRSRRRSTAWAALLCGACVSIVAEGCLRTPAKSPLMEDATNLIDMTSVQLRQQVYDFANRFATVVQDAADTIMEETDDPGVRERALLWKIRVIPEVHRAAFKPDPLFALIDTAVLCGQLEDFFRDGAGSSLFGEQQEIAIDASAMLNREIWKLGESITHSGDPARARNDIAGFVAAHPIDDIYFLRDSVDSLVAVMKKGRPGKAGATLGGITDAVDDLSRRLTIYAAYLPNEARWQAELAAMRMMRDPRVKETMDAAEAAAEAHVSLARSVADTVDLIPAEREAAFHELETLSELRIADIDQQRQETIAALRSEREVLVRAFEAQTEKTLLRIGEERIATLSQLQAIVDASIDASFDRADDMADRLFLRLVILIVILAAALLAVALLIARMLRPRPARL